MACIPTPRAENSRTARPTPACLSTWEPSKTRFVSHLYFSAVRLMCALYSRMVNNFRGNNSLSAGPGPISLTLSPSAVSAFHPPFQVRRRLRER